MNKASTGDGRIKPEYKKLLEEGIFYGIPKKKRKK